MHEVDPRIVIQSIDESTPSWNVTAVSRAGRIGQYYTGTERRYRDIVIKFAIRIIRDLPGREEVLQKVAAWATGGHTLTVSYREGQRLPVICSALPAVQGIDRWAEAYQLTLRAYGIPDWIAAEAETETASGSSGTAALEVTANGGGKLELSAVNSSSGNCNVVQVSVGTQVIRFENLGLAAGETLAVSYDDNDVMSAKIGTRSVLAKRTTASVDDIWLESGENTITYSSGQALGWIFGCYGRWIG